MLSTPAAVLLLLGAADTHAAERPAFAARTIEAVSPQGAEATVVGTPTFSTNRAVPARPVSADGNRVLYTMTPPPTLDAPTGYFNQVLSERTATGWTTRAIYPTGVARLGANFPHGNGTGIRFSPALDVFSGLMGPGADVPMRPFSDLVLAPGVSDEPSYLNEYAGVVMAADGRAFSADSGGLPIEQPWGTVGQGIIEPFVTATKIYFGSVNRLSADAPASLGAKRAYERSLSDPPTFIGRLPGGEVAETSDVLDATQDGAAVLLSMAGADGVPHLYVRNASGVALVSGPSLGADPTADGFSEAFFTADGSAVVFATREPLVADDTDASIDLYRYDVASRQLVLVTAHAGLGNRDSCADPDFTIPDSCDVALSGVSSDGRYVYFTSNEPLVDGVEQQASLVYGTGPTGAIFATPIAVPAPRVSVSPTGDAVFESADELIDGQTTGGMQQLYVFDHADGSFRCISCGTSAGPPIGSAALGVVDNAPSYSTINVSSFTGDGSTLFFSSSSRLVGADASGVPDVYAYDFSSKQVALITSGRSSQGFTFAGVNASGTDVFFAAREVLLKTDAGAGGNALYDARIGGGFPAAPTAITGCEGAGCRQVVAAPPAAETPGSSTTPAEAGKAAAPQPELGTPSRSALRKLLTTRGLQATVSRVEPGDPVVVRLVLRAGPKLLSTTTAASTSNSAKRTVTLRLTRTQRTRLRRALAKDAVSAELSATVGKVALSNTTQIRRTGKKG